MSSDRSLPTVTRLSPLLPPSSLSRMEISKLAHGFAKALKLSPGPENLDSRLFPMEKIDGLRVSSPPPSSILPPPSSFTTSPDFARFPSTLTEKDCSASRPESLGYHLGQSLMLFVQKEGGNDEHRMSSSSSRCPSPRFLKQSRFVAEYLPSFINAIVSTTVNLYSFEEVKRLLQYLHWLRCAVQNVYLRPPPSLLSRASRASRRFLALPP